MATRNFAHISPCIELWPNRAIARSNALGPMLCFIAATPMPCEKLVISGTTASILGTPWSKEKWPSRFDLATPCQYKLRLHGICALRALGLQLLLASEAREYRVLNSSEDIRKLLPTGLGSHDDSIRYISYFFLRDLVAERNSSSQLSVDCWLKSLFSRATISADTSIMYGITPPSPLSPHPSSRDTSVPDRQTHSPWYP